MSRRRASSRVDWLQATINSWQLNYEFGTAPPKEAERFRDILGLELYGVVHWPEEWRGAEIECHLSADRKIETAMRLGKPPAGQPYTDNYFEDQTDCIGTIHSVPATRRPKQVVFNARLPQDMFIETAHLIRLEVWRALSISFVSKPPPAHPRARWITRIGFQATVDP